MKTSLISEYKGYLLNERGVSVSTVEVYAAESGRFIEWVERNQKKLKEIGTKELEKYIIDREKDEI